MSKPRHLQKLIANRVEEEYSKYNGTLHITEWSNFAAKKIIHNMNDRITELKKRIGDNNPYIDLVYNFILNGE